MTADWSQVEKTAKEAEIGIEITITATIWCKRSLAIQVGAEG
jgi:hypothetical protein